MSNSVNNAPEGIAVDSSASTEDKSVNQEPKQNSPFEKILKEKKNAMSRIAELESKLKEKEEAELLAKEEHKELAERFRLEKEEALKKLAEKENLIKRSLKEGVLRKEFAKLGATADTMDYLVKLANIDSIEIDEDTATVMGADSAAKVLSEKLPQLFGVKKVDINQDAPEGIHGPITLEEYKKLPYEEKLKRKADLEKTMGFERRK